ncbi:nucleoside-diphosphate-sugar epimerase family protein [Xylariaceae sp. FL0594]|nr:nucleoside-diphosphate-sugar epimerase family protein [Xylariaceae sp. FL0594]
MQERDRHIAVAFNSTLFKMSSLLDDSAAMASVPHKILVVGATGQQGGAVLAELAHLAPTTSALLSRETKILVLTRSAVKAQSVIEKYGQLLNLEIVEGDTRNPGPIFAAHGDIDAIFALTTMPAREEEEQARDLITSAARHGVRHFVYSSVERGGDDRSWENPTNVPHFVTKHNIEHHLRNVCTENPSMKYTILRPVAFMDNLNPTSPFGPIMAALWATMPNDTKLQVVSVRDIGVFAVKALLHPHKFENRALGLAGDELTLLDVRATYRRVAGLQLPQAWTIVGYAMRWMVEEIGSMFTFFEKEGYHVDIRKLRSEEPRLQDFETWLKESSKFECGLGKK